MGIALLLLFTFLTILFSISDYISLNGGLISEQRILKDSEGNGHGLV
jgi:hypothetical protein